MTRRRLGVALCAALGVFGGVFMFWPAHPESSPDRPPVHPQSSRGKIAPTVAAPAALPPAAPPTQQVPLPRPPRAQLDAGRRPIAHRPQPSGPVDKRDNPGPNAGRQMEIIRYAFDTIEEDVQECLAQWEATSPGQAAEVMIAFEIDANGLQRSWLEHDAEVPFGPRSCLANAVYGLDWSHIVEQPAKLTQRFELGTKDGG